MKTVSLIIICALGLTLSASAQKVVHVVPRARVSVGVGFGGFGYSPFYGYYNPFYAYPPYGYGYNARPSKLDLEIEDIRNDYKDRIWSARHDEHLSRKDRRKEVHTLKSERDQAVLQAKMDYYKRQ